MSLSVEEALESISVLPLEVRRHQELLHTLDVRWIGHMTDLRKAHENYIKGVRARAEKLPKDGSVNVRKEAADEKDLAAVMALSAECRQVSEEKVSVARQSQETVMAAITKLEAYLRDFEEELRQSGELNDEVRVASRRRWQHSTAPCWKIRSHSCHSFFPLPLPPHPSPYPNRSMKRHRVKQVMKHMNHNMQDDS
jgi:hypothetical protein